MILNRLIKTIILIFILLVFLDNANAQKMDEPKIDGFTGEATLLTKMEQIAASPGDGDKADYLWVYFTVKSGNNFNIYINTDAQYDQHVSYTIAKGNNIYFKLKDGTFINLVNPKSVTAVSNLVHNHYYKLAYWSATFNIALSCKEMDKIIFSDFAGVRVETSNGPLDFAIQPKKSKILNKMGDLIESAGGGCP